MLLLTHVTEANHCQGRFWLHCILCTTTNAAHPSLLAIALVNVTAHVSLCVLMVKFSSLLDDQQLLQTTKTASVKPILSVKLCGMCVSSGVSGSQTISCPNDLSSLKQHKQMTAHAAWQ